MTNKRKKLDEYLGETRIVPPNDLGIPLLTYIYRHVNVFFKTAPFVFIVPLSILGSMLLVGVFGYLAIRLVSLLQYGF